MNGVRRQKRAGEAAGGPVASSRRDAVTDWLGVFVPLLGLPQRAAEEVRDELEDHLRTRVDDLMIAGLSESEATRRAVAELGETADLALAFRSAREQPRRRRIMQATILGMAGVATVMSAVSLFSGQHGAGQPATAGATLAGEVEAAPGAALSERVRRYDVRELVFADAPLAETNEGLQLRNTIYELVQPAMWEINGGEARLTITGNTLFVDADADLHNGVAWVIRSLVEDAAAIRLAAELEIQEQAAVQRERRDSLAVDYERLQSDLERVLLQKAELEREFNKNAFATSEAPRDPAFDHLTAEVQRQMIDLQEADVRDRIQHVRQALLQIEYDTRSAPTPMRRPMSMSGRPNVEDFRRSDGTIDREAYVKAVRRFAESSKRRAATAAVVAPSKADAEESSEIRMRLHVSGDVERGGTYEWTLGELRSRVLRSSHDVLMDALSKAGPKSEEASVYRLAAGNSDWVYLGTVADLKTDIPRTEMVGLGDRILVQGAGTPKP